MVLREQSVALGVEFLSHPNVVSHSREDKTSFLRGKGLTGEEIDEAFKRVNGDVPPTAPAAAIAAAPVQHQQQYYAPPPPPQEESMASWLISSIIPASLAISSGASLMYFYKNYVLNEQQQQQQLPGFFPQQQGLLQPPPLMPEQAPPAGLQPNPTMAPPTPAAQLNNAALPPWMQQHANAAPAPTANDFVEKAPNSSPKPQQQESDPLLRETLDALKETVELLKQQQANNNNGGGDLQASLPVILQAMQSSSEVKAELSAIKSLLLASLVRGGNSNNDTVSSSTPSNNNMDLIQSLLQKSGEPSPVATPDVITATSTTPSQEEEEATEDAKLAAKQAKETEEALTKARSALADMATACEKLDSETIAGGCGMIIMFLKNLLKDPMNPRYRRIAKGNANYAKLLQPLEGHSRFLDAVGFEERGGSFELNSNWTQNLQEQAAGFAREVLADSVTNLEQMRDKARGSSTTPAPAAPVSDAPAYPLSFEEIIRLQKEGKRPEGIKDIPNDRLSQDAPSKPVLAQPRKPWEKISIEEIVDNTEEEEEERRILE